MNIDFYQWLDLFWLPLALAAARKGHRMLAAGFVLICVFTLRLQVELMEEIGYENGFLPFLDSDALTRGYYIYGFFIGLFLVLAYYSPRTRPVVFMAAALSLYVISFCISMAVMFL